MRPLTLLALAACAPDPIVLDSGTPAQDSPAGDDTGVDSVPTVSASTCTITTLAGAPAFSGAQLYATEGDAISWQIACEESPDAELTLAAPPGSAVWSANALTWTPGLADAARYDLVLVALIDGEQVPAIATLWVADAWNDPDNVEVDKLTYAEEFGVPVLNLEVPGNANYSYDVAADLYWQGHQFNVGMQYRGASSSYYPKHSFVLSFPPDDEFDAPGWKKRRNLNITSTFDDNSYVRQKTCYDLWSALSETHPVFQTMMVVVYLNNQYEGLQVITDHIDGEWWEDNGGREDANLYKAVDHSANLDSRYGGARKSSLTSGYEKKAGDDDWSDLEELVDYVANSDDATFLSEMDSRLSRDDFMNWWVFVRFVNGGDSGGKNSYLYHDPLDAAGLWRYTPWDFNHSLGQDWQTIRVSADYSEDFTSANRFFDRVFENEDLTAEMHSRMRVALDGPFAKETILAGLDADYAVIDAAARRDWEKWEPQYDDYWGWRGPLEEYDGEVAYLRQWVADRWDYMDDFIGP